MRTGGEGGAYRAAGIFGQGIYIDPAANIVIAMHSAWNDASVDSDWALQAALYDAVAKAVGEPGARRRTGIR